MITYVYIVVEDAVRQFSSSHHESHVFGSAPDVEKRSGSPRAVERRDSASWWPEKPPETVGECNKNLGFTGSKTMDLKSKIWGSTWFFECWGFFNGQLTMVLGPTFGYWIKQRQVRVLSSIRHQVRGLNSSKSSHKLEIRTLVNYPRKLAICYLDGIHKIWTGPQWWPTLAMRAGFETSRGAATEICWALL